MKKLIKTKVVTKVTRCRRKVSKNGEAFGGYKIVYIKDGVKKESDERYETKAGAELAERTCIHLNN